MALLVAAIGVGTGVNGVAGAGAIGSDSLAPVTRLAFYDDHSISLYDTLTGASLTVFSDGALLFSEIHGKVLERSPTSDVVAAMGTDEAQAAHLLVVSPSAGVLADIPDGRRFSWSPDGGKVAYITGPYREGGLEFSPSGLWIMDLETGSARRLDEHGGADVHWARFDGMIYVVGDSVERYDPMTGSGTETSHRGIYFSPDGDHYFAPSYEGSTSGIFRTRTDQLVLDLYPHPAAVAWSSDSRRALVKRYRASSMLDIHAGTVIRTFDRLQQLHWTADEQRVLGKRRNSTAIQIFSGD